ncbi:uncharacterized protein BO66DRAFT_450114 [Aspergillus aculeatinus CBS 121060]|uniref:Uncharacterized protein n=1 Tax=Aspergillus aculeatinus CBS 121060 TaxID=1448322 RepID=A0ACD1HMM8_9EURO|nr:hypothetical protein BO66DRAFT_450114 [Aspergillus aculeatinus CBS 121060]RAH75114.1 hypothetical protein BO66DRAFT_450114 [Aspergillus aculeatinus CBS 121060]
MATEDETDINYATPYIYASWALTAIAGLTLLFRFAIKSWIRWALPRVSSPDRLWGFEDLFYTAGYSFDLAHIALVQRSYEAGLGRHLWFLTSDELRSTLKNEFISQPLAVVASMLSRTRMMCFLYSCFNGADRRIHISILVCIGVQIIINMVTVVQIIVQCGPSSYLHYFHYMWDDLPYDGSVICQSPSVQTMVGFAQGGFNSGVDLFLTALSAIQLWRYTMRATDRGPSHSESFCFRFQKIPCRSRNRRLWQTCALSDNIVPFVLWVKIENYSILLATCAPIIRLLVSSVSNNGSPSKDYPGSGILSGGASQGLELDLVRHTNDQDTVALAMPMTDKQEGRILSGAERMGIHHARSVVIRTDIHFHFDSDRSSTRRLMD